MEKKNDKYQQFAQQAMTNPRIAEHAKQLAEMPKLYQSWKKSKSLGEVIFPIFK